MGEAKPMGEVCLDGEKNDRMAFQSGADYQNHDIRWRQRGYSSLDGGTVVHFPRSWTSSGECRLNPAGNETELFRDVELAPGTLLLVPSEEDWFTLEGEPGPYKFVLETDSGLKVSQTVNLVPAAAPPVFADLKTGGEITWMPKAVPLEALANLRSARDFKSNKTAAPGDISLRGVGAEIYKKSARGVVVVVAGDGFGSGSIISKDGTILTNWHVVQGHNSAGVYFKPPGGGEIAAADRFEADVLMVDEVADLALLRLRAMPRGYPVLPLGDMTDVEIAMDVHAIGHPLGEFWTYTRGTVSQVRAHYEWLDEWLSHSAEVIQTQTPINPGNSGGPLFSDDGKIIGINSFVSPEAQGINFAVSVGEVRRFIASKTDRKLPKPPKNPKSLKGLPMEAFDFNENGVTDVIGVDVNRNGLIELYIVDDNEDGQEDYRLWDENENGRIDTQFLSTVIEGKDVDLWLFDTNEDDEFDISGIDIDQDGIVDRYQHLTP